MKILTRGNRHRSRIAAVGMYDGVHSGHQFLINFLCSQGAERGLTPSVITFEQHPMTVVRPEDAPRLLNSFHEKTELLARAGVEDCIVLKFDDKMRRMSAKEFLTRLRKKYDVRALVIGFNNSLGYDRLDNIESFRRIAEPLKMEIIPAPEYVSAGTHISSSRVRAMLQHGELKEANEALGRPYSIIGRVIDGDKLGRQLGFPTANIQPVERNQIVPDSGVYAARVVTPDGVKRNAIVNIGVRPTISSEGSDKAKTTIEVHILDFTGYLYDEEITLEFIEYLRAEKKFRSLENLKKQLEADARKARRILG